MKDIYLKIVLLNTVKLINFCLYKKKKFFCCLLKRPVGVLIKTKLWLLCNMAPESLNP